MAGEAILDEFKALLPPYLSAATKEELFKQLKEFPKNRNYFALAGQVLDMPDPLQGDGWAGFVAIRFETLERKTVSGIILSNSCDISPGNRRNLPVNILFAPLIQLGRYAELLEREGKRQPEDVKEILESIRRQETTSIFYLPPSPNDSAERMVLLDDVHAHPVANFLGGDPSRLFRLSNYGFYVFLYKLSLHFMRIQEGIDRT
jgi:hypothetical protein